MVERLVAVAVVAAAVVVVVGGGSGASESVGKRWKVGLRYP